MEIAGDLNKDNLEDKVIATQDTVHQNAPYQLQIFFKEPNGQFKLITTSTKIITAQFPDGRDAYKTGDLFGEIAIKNGVLIIIYDLLRGNYQHKFRYQNGNFELIGFTSSYSDGMGQINSEDYNLSTGLRIEKLENYETGKVTKNETKKIMVRPLPKLQDVIPLENELY